MIHSMTSGNPIKLILLFSLPVFIGNLFQQMYMLSDMIVVGRFLGVQSLAAVGAMIPVFVLFLLMSFGFTSGLSIIVAQRFGAHDYQGVRQSFALGCFLSILFSLMIVGISLLGLEPVLDKMYLPDEIKDEALRFISVLLYGVSAMILYNYLSNVLRALGDSKTPLYFLIFSCIINLGLNLYFILKLQWGVQGSAFGSVCAQVLSVFLCGGYIFARFSILRIRIGDLILTGRWIYQHMRLAVPMALQFSVIGLGALIIQVVCNQFGTDAIAAMAAGIRIEQVATLPLVSMGAGLVTFTAQNFGARKIRRIRTGVWQSSLFSFLISMVIAGIVHFYGNAIVRLFLENPSQEMVVMAQTYLEITTLFYVFLGQIFIFRQTLQGVGQSMIPLLSGFVELLMRAFVAVFLAGWFGYIGICYASPVAWIGASVVVSAGYFYEIRRLYHRTIRPRKMVKAKQSI